MKQWLIAGVILCFCSITASSGLCPIKIGSPVPPFALCDQNNSTITHQNILGKIVVMNFIFTRCAEPTKCPTAMRKMQQLQKLVNEDSALQKDVRFITITFDPKHDTPEILLQYAKGFCVDLSNYSFLTGCPEIIQKLTKAFGVFTVTEKGTINHTMKTVIIDKKGIMIYENSSANWDPKALLKVIQGIKK